MSRKPFFILILLALSSFGTFAQSDQQPETDPIITHRISQWQDLKFGFMMHWGIYAQWGVVEKSEVSPMTKKLMGGLNLSLQRLLTLRCRHNGSFCFCDADGNIYTVKAKEVRAMMEQE